MKLTPSRRRGATGTTSAKPGVSVTAFCNFSTKTLVLQSLSPRQSSHPETLFPSEDYPSGSTATLNIFRYFAKLLSCQIADAGGPRLPVLAAFAIGTIDFNPVKLIIKADATYQDFVLLSPELAALAGHGGLVVNHDKEGLLNSFHSTLIIGPVQYVYWVEFNESVSGELNLATPEFYARTQAAFAKALDEPMSDHMRRKLGFLSAEDCGAPG